MTVTARLLKLLVKPVIRLDKRVVESMHHECYEVHNLCCCQEPDCYPHRNVCMTCTNADSTATRVHNAQNSKQMPKITLETCTDRVQTKDADLCTRTGMI